MDKYKLLENFITDNTDSIYRFAYTYVKNVKDAEDVASESVLRAIKAINSLRKPEYIKAWFYRIVANTSVNFLKSQKRYQYTEDNGEISVEDRYDELNFYSIIDSLDIKYREIIVLRFLEDMTIKEISEILRINENTVKTRLYKALKILRIHKEDLI